MITKYVISDEDLLRRVLRNSKVQFKGSSVREMLEHLNNEEAFLIKEICSRYTESRLETGDTFSNARQIFEHFKIRLSKCYQEIFLELILDNKHHILDEKVISLGTLNQSLVHPREVFASAIEQRAAAIILVHNHPSGDATPSNQDIAITQRLVDVGEIVGIKILDHVIIGNDCYFSFVDEQLILT